MSVKPMTKDERKTSRYDKDTVWCATPSSALRYLSRYERALQDAEEANAALTARVRDLEDAQGELLETLSRSVLVSERPDYCRVCDRYFP